MQGLQARLLGREWEPSSLSSHPGGGLTALFVSKQMDPMLVSEHFDLVAVPAGGPWPPSLSLSGWLLPTLPVTSVLIPASVGAEAALGRPSFCSPGQRPSCLPQAVSGTCCGSMHARRLSYTRSFSVSSCRFWGLRLHPSNLTL